MSSFFSHTLLTVLAVDLLALSGDIVLTWTSPMFPKLYSNDSAVNPLPRPISQSEESWLGSLLNIGALVGTFPIGFLSEWKGRKVALIVTSVPHIIAFALLALVPNLLWYYVARFLCGIADGAASALIPLYISEIAEDSNRGMLSVTMNIFWTFGDLVPYMAGPYLSAFTFNLVLLVFPSAFFLLFTIVGTETPYYLVKRDKLDAAEQSLMKLRGKSRKQVAKEMNHIKKVIENDERGAFVELFKTKANRKALLIAMVLIAAEQFSGINVVLFYTQLIFESSGSYLPAEISSIIIGLVLFASSFIIPFFADRFGRRFFLSVSCIGITMSLGVFGTYFFFKENLAMDLTQVSWIPMLSLVAYIVTFNIGLASLPWTVSSELFPVALKSHAASLASCTCWTSSFLVTKFFNDLNNLVGKAGTFWMYSGFSFLTLLFVVFYVPETKGKSFKEIHEILEK